MIQGRCTVFLAWEERHAELFNAASECRGAEFFPVNQKAAAPWFAHGHLLTLPPFWQLYRQIDLDTANLAADQYLTGWRGSLQLEANAARAWIWAREAAYLRRLLSALEKCLGIPPRYLVPCCPGSKESISWHGANRVPTVVMEILASEGSEVQWITGPGACQDSPVSQPAPPRSWKAGGPEILFSTFAVPDLADHLTRLLELHGLSILLLVDPVDPLPSIVIEQIISPSSMRVAVVMLERRFPSPEKTKSVVDRLTKGILASGPDVEFLSKQLETLVEREGLIGCLVSDHHAVQTIILRRLCNKRHLPVGVLPHSVWPMLGGFSLGLDSVSTEIHMAATRSAAACLAGMGHQNLAKRPFPSPRYRPHAIRLLRRLPRWLSFKIETLRIGVVVTSGEELSAPDLPILLIADSLRALCHFVRTNRKPIKLYIRLRDREDFAEVLKTLIGPDGEIATWEKSSQRTPFAYLQEMDLIVEVGTPGSVTYESFAQVIPFIRMEAVGLRPKHFLLPHVLVPHVRLDSCRDFLKYCSRFYAVMLTLRQFCHLVRQTSPAMSFKRIFKFYSSRSENPDNAWVLVDGKLTSEQRDEFVNALLDGNQLEGEVLPIQPSGTVHEIVQCSTGMKIEAGLSTRTMSLFERTWRMAWRAWRTWTYLSIQQRKLSGLTLSLIVTDLTTAYRIATEFRGISYSKWIDAQNERQTSSWQSIGHDLLHEKNRPNFVIVLLGTDSVRREITIASLNRQTFFDFTIVDTLPRTAEANSWFLMLSEGDQLAEYALHWIAYEILLRSHVEAIYFDDDEIDEAGNRSRPCFKPDWSLAHLRARNYIGRAVALKGMAVLETGGLSNSGLYDLLLRMAERTTGKWGHIPAVLLHRGYPEAPDDEHELSALNLHLARSVSGGGNTTMPGCRRVHFTLPLIPPRVSIIIPTRDAADLLRRCVESLLAKTTYSRYEIVVVNNGSHDQDALEYLEEIALWPQVSVVEYDRPFNYSAINNFAVAGVSSEVLCLLNNDTEIISPDWLDEMVGHLLQENVGAVGAKLYYPDGRVQHGGDTVGPGGCANHLHQFIAPNDPGYCHRAMVAQELSAVTAACMVTWRSLYKKLGGLNERWLPVAFNDVDYCLRVRKAGYKIVWTPHAELYHHESVSRGKIKNWRRVLRAWCEVRYMRWHWHKEMKNDPFYNPNFSYLRPDFVLGPVPNVNKPWLARE